jgi:hypothetical protein
MFTEHTVHIPYTWSDVILCIVWRHKSRLHLMWLQSVHIFVYFLYRSSYKSYSKNEKYDIKTGMKSEMHNISKMFRRFYPGQISETSLNIPAHHTASQSVVQLLTTETYYMRSPVKIVQTARISNFCPQSYDLKIVRSGVTWA